MKPSHQSLIAILICYIIWGILPLYFSLLSQLPAQQIIVYRIIFSALFMIILIIILGYQQIVKQEISQLLHQPRMIGYLLAASLLIIVNWLTYVMAIQNHQVLEASFGYYLNPIITILFAVIFLKEKLSRAQTLACLFVACALGYLFISAGTLPWIALILAGSFGLYSLCKKQITLSSTTGLLVETILTTPFAIVYLITQPMFNISQLNTLSFIAWLMLGIVTAIPLLLFAIGTKHMPLYLIGILQYIPPTIQFILGITIYQESLDIHRFVAFIFIWLAVIIFCYSTFKQTIKNI